MANWWDFGIRGRDSEYMVASGALTQGGYNLSSFVSAGSVSLEPNPINGRTYTRLLLSTSSGTQIYCDLTASYEHQTLYLPYEENAPIWNFTHQIRIRKNGTDFQVDAPSGGQYSKIVAGGSNIYEYIYRAGNGYITNALSCYPIGGRGGGATNQIAMVSNNNGVYFYAVGYPYPDDPVNWNHPASLLGYIPASILNNRAWFDPESDGIDEETYKQIIGTGETPDRPVDYDYAGDDIDFPSLPSGASMIGFGRMNIFHPTSAQLASALDILWSDSDETTLETIIESCKKWWYKPEQYCVSLMLMPVNVSGTNTKIYFGKYDTLTTAPAIANQWQSVDCGSLQIPLKSNSAFDFSPYVKAMIFLPYVGFRPINVNEIMGGTVYVKYYVDMFTGTALCMVKVSNSNSNTSVLYSYECNIAQQIPITSENYNQVINSLISASISIGTAVAAPNPFSVSTAVEKGAGAIGGIGSPDIQTSGKLNPNTGALGNAKPYIVLHFPVQSVSTGFVNQNGYPSSVNVRLGNLSGYTEVEKIHLNIPGATNEELNEIQRMLYEGVVL